MESFSVEEDVHEASAAERESGLTIEEDGSSRQLDGLGVIVLVQQQKG